MPPPPFQVCDGDLELVAKVECCRQAILEDLRVEFAEAPLAPTVPQPPRTQLPPPFPVHPRGNGGRGRGWSHPAADRPGPAGSEFEVSDPISFGKLTVYCT